MVVQFIIQDPAAPNAAKAAQLRKQLRSIDPELELVVHKDPGAERARCWVQAPQHYGQAEFGDRRKAAVSAFRAILPA